MTFLGKYYHCRGCGINLPDRAHCYFQPLKQSATNDIPYIFNHNFLPENRRYFEANTRATVFCYRYISISL